MSKTDLLLLTLNDDQITNFWLRITIDVQTVCWPWTGARQPRGYGIVRFNGVVYLAHRIALFVTKGAPSVDQTDTLHACDNPPCCNPSHLSWGTHAANGKEMGERGLSGLQKHPESALRGEKNPRAKITDAQALVIIRSTEPQAVLAKRYGIQQSTVSRIKNGVLRCHSSAA